MANRYIDATLRFRDQFTGEFGKAAKQMSEQEKHLRKVSGSIIKAGRGISNAGKTLTTGVTTPIVGLGVAAVKTTATFDEAMSKVAASMGKTVDEIGNIREAAKKLGEETAFSNAEAAEGFNILAQAGLTAEQQLDAIRPVLDLAAAGAMDMGNAASFVTGSVMGFGDSMKNAGKYADQIALGATLAKTDTLLFGEAVSRVSSTAKGFGQSATSTEAALLRLANAGNTGEAASRQLIRAMTNVYAPTKKAQDAMKELGVSAYDGNGKAKDFNKIVEELRGSLSGLTEKARNAKINQIFSTVGAKAFRDMTSMSAEATEELVGQLEKAGGSAGKQAATMLDNLNGQLTILKSSGEGILTTIGEKIMPYVRKGVEYVQSLADKIKGLSDRQWDLIFKIAGVVAVVGPALLIVGKVIMTTGKMIRTFSQIRKAFTAVKTAMSLMNPHMLIIVAVGAAVALVATWIIKHWDDIKPLFEKIGEALKKFGAWCGETFTKVKDWFVNTYNTLKSKFQSAMEKVRSSPGVLGAAFRAVKGHIDAVKQVFSGIITFIKGVFSGNWKQAWQGIVKIFGGIWAGIKNMVKAPLNGMIGIINKAIQGLNKIQINLPDWLGGKSFGFNLHTIPLLASGTPYFTGGPAIINEKGGEIVNLPRGMQIIPHDQSVRQAVGFGRRIAEQQLSGQIIRLADVLRTRQREQLPVLSTAAAAAAPGTVTQKGKVEKHITIAKIADTVVIKEKADADALAETIAKKLEALDGDVA